MAFDWASLLTQRLSSPDWRYSLAYDGPNPYALGGMYLKGDIGWMAPVWTLPANRNEGRKRYDCLWPARRRSMRMQVGD
jgi:hypothetical protein